VRGKTRHLIPFDGGLIEAWGEQLARDADSSVFVLKFGGTGSRAERSTCHPLDFWDRNDGEVWAVNLPGYGCSSGRASLQRMAAAGMAAYHAAVRAAADRPLLITGNSLGTTIALYVAAAVHVDGLILRNPPPLRELIVGRYGQWNLGLGAKLIAAQVPSELNSILNAQLCTAPCVWMTSGQDRVVPPEYQQMVIDAYAGSKKIVTLADADHASPPVANELIDYARKLAWLQEKIYRPKRAIRS